MSKERVFELNVNSFDEVQVVIRPAFKQEVDSFSVTASQNLRLTFANGTGISFDLEPEQVAALLDCDEILLVEFPVGSGVPARETCVARLN